MNNMDQLIQDIIDRLVELRIVRLVDEEEKEEGAERE